MKRHTVGELVELLLRHGTLDSRVVIIDPHGAERPVAAVSGTKIDGIQLYPGTPPLKKKRRAPC
jgi:hypothetical protein